MLETKYNIGKKRGRVMVYSDKVLDPITESRNVGSLDKDD